MYNLPDMQSVVQKINDQHKKPAVVDVRSGDTVRVHQKIREGNKERIQIFEGLVIKTTKANSPTRSITVRRIASSIGVEKTYMVHSPLITKIEVVKRSKVRRNYLSYMRQRTGKSARLSSVEFDQKEVNKVPEPVKEKPQAENTEEAPKPAVEEKQEEPKSEKKADEKKDEPKNDSPQS